MKMEPLEFQLDCAEDDLSLTNDKIRDLIYELYKAQKRKRRIEHLIASLEFEIG